MKKSIKMLGAGSMVSISLLGLPSITWAAQQGGLETVLASGETVFFIGAILLLTIYFGHIRYTRFSLAHGPEILTTAGIMGCFLGIAMALLHFDATNVQASIPLLLNGVKTAFWSSLAGVAGALYLRFLHHVKKTPVVVNADSVKSASLDDVVVSLVALRQGLIGDEQGTLLSQMKLQRQETNDKQDELIKEFRNFSAHMIENSQKAIIEALRQVIADFNTKLTEQFGENFKQLNVAVEKLVVWQQQYREELDQLKSVQQQAAADLRDVADKFSELVNRSERFAAIADTLHSQLDFMERQRDVLFKQEKELAEVLSTMKQVTPEFATKVDTMLKEIDQGVTKVQTEIATVVKNLGMQVQQSNAELKNLLADTITKSQNEIGTALKSHVTTIKEGVIALDTALQKELNDSLETLGRQLASLSNKFVEDYSPLTDRLREIVRMSASV